MSLSLPSITKIESELIESGQDCRVIVVTRLTAEESEMIYKHFDYTTNAQSCMGIAFHLVDNGGIRPNVIIHSHTNLLYTAMDIEDINHIIGRL